MAEREQDLRQLRRGDLVELMLEQAKQLESVKRELRRRDEELEQCRKELEEARAALGKREIDLDEAGSIAEAALRVNGIFEAAQAAGQQYLDNIQRLSQRQSEICAQRDAESRAQAEMMLAQTRQRCREMEEQARAQFQTFQSAPAQPMYQPAGRYQPPQGQPAQGQGWPPQPQAYQGQGYHQMQPPVYPPQGYQPPVYPPQGYQMQPPAYPPQGQGYPPQPPAQQPVGQQFPPRGPGGGVRLDSWYGPARHGGGHSGVPGR